MVLQGPCAIASAERDRQTEVLGSMFAAAAVMQLIGPAAGVWTYDMVEEFVRVGAPPDCALSVFALVLLLAVNAAAFSQERARRQGGDRGGIPLILTMRWEDVPYICHVAIVIPDNELGGLGMTSRSLCLRHLVQIWCLEHHFHLDRAMAAMVIACFLPFSPTIPVANVLHQTCGCLPKRVCPDLLNATETPT